MAESEAELRKKAAAAFEGQAKQQSYVEADKGVKKPPKK
jgi:hypothetical protein